MVGWIAGEAPGSRTDARNASSGAAFFRDSAKGLIACLLADLLWDPALTPVHKTLRTLRRRLVTPPEQMPELLRHVHTTSHSPMARDIAGSLIGLRPKPSAASSPTPPATPAGSPPARTPTWSPAGRRAPRLHFAWLT